jgi:hypothetical protein
MSSPARVATCPIGQGEHNGLSPASLRAFLHHRELRGKNTKTHEEDAASHARRAPPAAILAADVAGYSRFMGGDEAGRVKHVRERCEP